MIGLILGDRDFPKLILKKIYKKKINHIIIDLTERKIFKKKKNSFSVGLGEFGKIIKILKKNNCKKILFAGNVKKPKFINLKLDIKGLYYMPRILRKSKIGDAALIKEIIKIFKSEKIKTINSLFFNPELTLKKGCYSKLKPDNNDLYIIKKGETFLNKLPPYDFSQAIVINNKKIIAVEKKNGTEQMLEKCRKFKHYSGNILIKYPKKKQDKRVDLPTVGFKTFKMCKKAGIKGIVLKKKQNIFLDKKMCIKFANKNKMFIISR